MAFRICVQTHRQTNTDSIPLSSSCRALRADRVTSTSGRQTSGCRRDDGRGQEGRSVVAILPSVIILTARRMVPAQGRPIKACQNAFQYFEGVVAAIVPDNLRRREDQLSVTKPVINEEFAAFAEHILTVPLPARVAIQRNRRLSMYTVGQIPLTVQSYLDIEGHCFHLSG